MKCKWTLIVVLPLLTLFLMSGCISTSGTGLVISSPDFADGDEIPAEFTCNGKNISPEIKWSGAPVNTRSFVMIMEDIDAPGGVFTHWTVYDMPKSMILLPTRMGKVTTVPGGIRQGTNDFGLPGYDGPCPPVGKSHQYVFTIYALDAMLDIAPGIDTTRLKEAMEPRILEQASITGTYASTAQ